ncbi:MAG: RIP metalloprotease RseP [Minisyncoccales bacterium]
MFFTILIAVLSLIGLFIIHELGHFLMAKKLGVRVEEFGIFFPPRLIGKKIGGTIYSLNLIPFGAFVRIYGEEEKAVSPESFSSRPIWQRFLIVLAGVLSFWLVAIILLSIVFHLGTAQIISDEENGFLTNPQVQIISVSSNSPASAAGLMPGDVIRYLGLKDQTEKLAVTKVKEVQEFVNQHRGEEVVLTIERKKDLFEVILTPRVEPPADEGALGVGLVRTAEKSYPIFQSFYKGIVATIALTGDIILALFNVLIKLISGQGLPQGAQLVGPIGIGSLVVQAVQVGLNYFLQFIALLSIYLAIFNLLPIPALDGGKLLFLGIEKIKGRPINQGLEKKITAAFFILLIILMIWVTIKDISRLF